MSGAAPLFFAIITAIFSGCFLFLLWVIINLVCKTLLASRRINKSVVTVFNKPLLEFVTEKLDKCRRSSNQIMLNVLPPWVSEKVNCYLSQAKNNQELKISQLDSGTFNNSNLFTSMIVSIIHDVDVSVSTEASSHTSENPIITPPLPDNIQPRKECKYCKRKKRTIHYGFVKHKKSLFICSICYDRREESYYFCGENSCQDISGCVVEGHRLTHRYFKCNPATCKCLCREHAAED